MLLLGFLDRFRYPVELLIVCSPMSREPLSSYMWGPRFES